MGMLTSLGLKLIKTCKLCKVRWSHSAVPILCDPVDCSLPGSSVHGVFQARVLEWVAISFSKGSSHPRDRTQVSRIVGRCYTVWASCVHVTKTRVGHGSDNATRAWPLKSGSWAAQSMKVKQPWCWGSLSETVMWGVLGGSREFCSGGAAPSKFNASFFPRASPPLWVEGGPH